MRWPTLRRGRGNWARNEEGRHSRSEPPGAARQRVWPTIPIESAGCRGAGGPRARASDRRKLHGRRPGLYDAYDPSRAEDRPWIHRLRAIVVIRGDAERNRTDEGSDAGNRAHEARAGIRPMARQPRFVHLGLREVPVEVLHPPPLSTRRQSVHRDRRTVHAEIVRRGIGIGVVDTIAVGLLPLRCSG
jgi:hypothetical protein